MANASGIVIRPASRDDVPAILSLIRDLAEYEKLAHECEADEAKLAETLFGDRPCAEVLIAEEAPIAPVYFYVKSRLLKPNVKGYPYQNPQDLVYAKDLYLTAQ